MPKSSTFRKWVLGAETGDEQVSGLDVAVHESVLMCFGERAARLAQQHDHPLGDLRPEAIHENLEIEALEQLHDVVEAAGLFTPKS